MENDQSAQQNVKLIFNIVYFGDNLIGVTGEWLGKKTDRVSFPSNPSFFKTTLHVHTIERAIL